LKTLIRYVKALQKDRIHIMNRYRHQLQSSPSDAEANRPQMVDHLANADRQLKSALYMLDRLSRYKDKIMKQIGASRRNNCVLIPSVLNITSSITVIVNKLSNCIAHCMVQTNLKRSGMDHTTFNLQRTPCQPLPRKCSPDGASTKCSGEHLIAAHYSFIDPEMMKG